MSGQSNDGAPTETTSLLDKSRPDKSLTQPDLASHNSNDNTDEEGETARIDETNVETGSSHHGQISSAKESVRASMYEVLLVLKGAIPVILAYTLQNSLQTVSILVVGRLSRQALAVSAFSYMFAASTGWLIALGGTTAIDTLASASFTGSKNPHDLGIILQRAFIVLAGLYVPVVALWACSERVFLALRQEPWLARDSQRFLLVLAPFGLGYVYFECQKKYLQAQEIMRGGTYVLLVVAPLNAGLNYLFVYTLGLGLLGAPLATGISYWLCFALLVAYTRLYTSSRGWGGWSRASLRNTGTFARLALLGILQVGAEWWAFETVALLAGTLGTVSLASQSVIMTADLILNTIPLGIGVAASARVGNLLGRRAAALASASARAATWLAILFGSVVLVVLMAAKNDFAKIANSDPAVVTLTAKVLPYVAAFQIADGIVGVNSGVLRGMGRQHIGAIVNIVCYYCGALPFGAWLAFHGWGLAGLWIGQCIALYLVGFAEWAIVAWSNWDKQVQNAFNRMDKAAEIQVQQEQQQQEEDEEYLAEA